MAWYKGNLHMHSYWSDGHDFPEMIAEWFKNAGYDFIAFTEHDRHQTGDKWVSRDLARGSGRSMADGGLFEKYVERFGCSWVETRAGDEEMVRVKPLAEYRHLFEQAGQFLIITGEEVTTSWGDAKDTRQTHWVNVFNTPEPVAPQHDPNSSCRAIQASFAAAQAMAIASGSEVLTYLNHPNVDWAATAEDIASVDGLRHIEIYTALNMCNTLGDEFRASAERIWDIALTLRLSKDGQLIYGLATDDCHTYAHHWQLGDTALPGRAWIYVQSEWLTPAHILAAVNRGDFYGSSGVVLDAVNTRDGAIDLAICPQKGVRYTTRFIGTLKGVDLSSQAVQDAQGKPLRTTRNYSNEIGQVLDETTSLNPSYTCSGDELYVRAVVTADREHPNPTGPNDFEKAWSQPVVPSAQAH